MTKYNEDYLNSLIAKAEKSWGGVGVDSDMSDLRDDLTDKEDAEKKQKAIENLKKAMKDAYNKINGGIDMNAVKIKCQALMVRDWCCDEHGFPMQITNVGDDYAYATFEGNECDPWEFDDKDDQPCAIEITEDILMKNGWKEAEYWLEYQDGENTIQFSSPNMLGMINGVFIEHFKCEYVHQYQHLLRLCGLNELADNFKI